MHSFIMNWQQMIRPDKIQVTSNPTTASLSVNRWSAGSDYHRQRAAADHPLFALWAAITAVKFEG